MSTTVAPSRLAWECVSTGIWIGRRDGRFAGVIEARPEGDYVANDSTLTVAYPTLAAAQAHFQG